MEISQNPGQAEDPPGHRWARILGTGVAVVTLTLPLVMIVSSSPFESNIQPITDQIYQPQNIRVNPYRFK